MHRLFQSWREYLKEQKMGPEWQQSQRRKEYLQSYERGAHKDAWIRYLEGEIFSENTPRPVVEKYYTKSILPQVENAIKTVSVEKGRRGKESHYSAAEKKIKVRGAGEKLTGPDSWEEYVFPHEFGHALDYLIDPLYGKNIPELSREVSYMKTTLDSSRHTMSSRQKSLCNKLFPGLGLRGSGDHTTSCEEVYADIMALRNEINKQYLKGERETNKFTAKDINNISAVSDFLPHHLEDALYDYMDRKTSLEDAAELLNMFAASTPKDKTTRMIAEYEAGED
jgi:hypothetical protein